MSKAAIVGPLIKNLYTTEQVRALDQSVIESHGISGTVLMKRAGRAAFQRLMALWPEATDVLVLCGAGNNGGDGYIVAALAAQRKLNVQLWFLSDPERLTGSAQAAFKFACQEGVAITPFDAQAFRASVAQAQAPIVVDALLGTGFTGELRPNFAEAISAINTVAAPVLSIDIPSGVDADAGVVKTTAVSAQVTISFIGQKVGLFTGAGRLCSGQRFFDDLQVPETVYSDQAPLASLLTADLAESLLAPRAADAHKGDGGYVMVIGGDYGYGGAPLMATEMALRSGAGLVGVATRETHIASILARCPEAMAQAVDSGQMLRTLLPRATVLVIGPGLGTNAWAEQLLYQAIMAKKPMVIDADGLNLLANPKCASWLEASSSSTILTPHPGEAARLLGTSVELVQADRIAAAQALRARFGGVVILKGPGSVVIDEVGQVSICDHGNPGMASGGMGDVLSGLLGALIAQGLSCADAARVGVAIHSQAADLAAEFSGEKGLLATDLIPYVRELING